jgi:general L-amino acid transport system substrate-binding protein
MNVTIVEAVGNYQEMFEEHLTPIGLTLDGGLNDLWTNGGLMYPPPYR